MSTSCRLLVADNMQRPRRSADQPSDPKPGGYEREHSERQVSGSVTLRQGVQWFATLAVPMTGDQSLLVTMERKGPRPPGAPEVDDVMLVIPPGESDAALELLRGIVAHARQDGVLRV